MNVARFDIEIRKNSLALRDFSIQDVVERRISKRSGGLAYHEVKNLVLNEWQNLPYKNVREIFQLASLFAGNTVRGIQYFLFKNGQQTNKDKLTLQVIFLSEAEDVSFSVQTVIDDLDSILSRWDYDIELAAILENNVYFYPYNHDDIYHWKLRLRGKFNNDSETWITVKRSAIATIVTAVSGIFIKVFPIYEQFFWELFWGCAFFLASDFWIYMRNRRPKIVIDDLANAMTENVVVNEFDDKAVDNLNSPDV